MQESQTPNSQPIHVLDSSIPKDKMEAISNLSKAILECAKALNSTNIIANISNCHIAVDPTNSEACGIKIGNFKIGN